MVKLRIRSITLNWRNLTTRHRLRKHMEHEREYYTIYSRSARHGFTLIERVPRKVGRISLVKSPDPTNCSFQVGSLTVGAHGNMRARRTVTKPPEGKSVCYGGIWPVPKALTGNGEIQIAGHLRQNKQMTRSQSGGLGKDTGRRITNVRRHRKSEPTRIADRVGDCGRLSPVRWEKPAIIREENGQVHLMFPVGVKGGGMC